jgi:XTP/dITP diphosphohydrolase
MSRILLASRNPKKLAEMQRILAPSFEVVGLDDVPAYDEVPEAGATFADNALIKAREGFAHTQMPTVADDSGLTVDALNGMPGVLSARWAGAHGDDEANLRLVLAQ